MPDLTKSNIDEGWVLRMDNGAGTPGVGIILKYDKKNPAILSYYHSTKSKISDVEFIKFLSGRIGKKDDLPGIQQNLYTIAKALRTPPVRQKASIEITTEDFKNIAQLCLERSRDAELSVAEKAAYAWLRAALPEASKGMVYKTETMSSPYGVTSRKVIDNSFFKAKDSFQDFSRLTLAGLKNAEERKAAPPPASPAAQTPAPPAAPTASPQPVVASKTSPARVEPDDDIRLVQALLNLDMELGETPDSINPDGLNGPATKKLITAYRNKNKIPNPDSGSTFEEDPKRFWNDILRARLNDAAYKKALGEQAVKEVEEYKKGESAESMIRSARIFLRMQGYKDDAGQELDIRDGVDDSLKQAAAKFKAAVAVVAATPAAPPTPSAGAQTSPPPVTGGTVDPASKTLTGPFLALGAIFTVTENFKNENRTVAIVKNDDKEKYKDNPLSVKQTNDKKPLSSQAFARNLLTRKTHDNIDAFLKDYIVKESGEEPLNAQNLKDIYDRFQAKAGDSSDKHTQALYAYALARIPAAVQALNVNEFAATAVQTDFLKAHPARGIPEDIKKTLMDLAGEEAPKPPASKPPPPPPPTTEEIRNKLLSRMQTEGGGVRRSFEETNGAWDVTLGRKDYLKPDAAAYNLLNHPRAARFTAILRAATNRDKTRGILHVDNGHVYLLRAVDRDGTGDPYYSAIDLTKHMNDRELLGLKTLAFSEHVKSEMYRDFTASQKEGFNAEEGIVKDMGKDYKIHAFMKNGEFAVEIVPAHEWKKCEKEAGSPLRRAYDQTPEEIRAASRSLVNLEGETSLKIAHKIAGRHHEKDKLAELKTMTEMYNRAGDGASAQPLTRLTSFNSSEEAMMYAQLHLRYSRFATPGVELDARWDPEDQKALGRVKVAAEEGDKGAKDLLSAIEPALRYLPGQPQPRTPGLIPR